MEREQGASALAVVVKVKAPGPWGQFRMLAMRALRQQSRDAYVNISRAVASALIGMALGTVNFNLGFAQKSIQSRASLLVQVQPQNPNKSKHPRKSGA